MDLPCSRFEGRDAFQQRVRDALQCAAREGWQELILSDAYFHDWPLGEREVCESLEQWSRAGRRITVLAWSFDDIVRRHARFVQWRVRWGHLIDCRRALASSPQDVPSALWSPHWVLERNDAQRCIGTTGQEPQQRVLLRQALGEWMERKSSPAFPATVLGL